MEDKETKLYIYNSGIIDHLMQLQEYDAVTLYIFYVKTARWQKTNIIKANDTYVIKTLHIGKNKLANAKKVLKEQCYIEIVQRREQSKVKEWYVKVNGLIKQNTQIEILENIELENQESKNPQTRVVEKNQGFEQEPSKPRTLVWDTNALIYNNNKYLNIYNIRKKDEKNENERKNNIDFIENKDKLKSYDEIIEEYTDNEELQKGLKEFIKSRQIKRNPLTNGALELNLKTLDELSSNELTKKIQIVNNTVKNGYNTFYSVKEENGLSNAERAVQAWLAEDEDEEKNKRKGAFDFLLEDEEKPKLKDKSKSNYEKREYSGLNELYDN